MQNGLILDHCKDHKGITTKEAAEQYGIERLAARIHDLKNAGFTVSSMWEKCPNRYGIMTRYKRYYVTKDDEQ